MELLINPTPPQLYFKMILLAPKAIDLSVETASFLIITLYAIKCYDNLRGLIENINLCIVFLRQ